MNIKLSIVIATYNASKTLKYCLNSVVSQMTPDCELLVIDGGSKDGTQDIIASYGEKISFTLSERDNGIYDAWNKGIKAATGDWICFIGADDKLLPGSIDIYLNIINNVEDIDTYDYICARNRYVDIKGNFLKTIGEAPKWSVMKRLMPAAHVASLHSKKNLFEQIGYYDYEQFKICSDYELLLRKKDKLRYLFFPNFTIAEMRIGGMSFSMAAIKETYEIRKRHQTIPSYLNLLLYVRDTCVFVAFIIKNNMCIDMFNRK